MGGGSYIVHGTDNLSLRENLVVNSEVIHSSVIIVHGPVLMQQIIVERPISVVAGAVVLIAGHLGLSDAVLSHVSHAALTQDGYLLLALIDVTENGDSDAVDVYHDGASSKHRCIVMPGKVVPAQVRVGRRGSWRLAAHDAAVGACKMPLAAKITTPKLR